MGMYPLLQILLFVGLQLLAPTTSAQEMASIPFEDSRLPSDDLFYEGRILRADEAHALSQQGMDLSLLNPAPSALWSHEKKILSPKDDELPVKDGDELNFRGALLSNIGLFRFNAVHAENTVIIHLDKTLHTMLLRKNLLRLLGYKVPAIKWIPQVDITFDNRTDMKEFMETLIHRATAGASCRWIEVVNIPDPLEYQLFKDSETHKATINSSCTWKLTNESAQYKLTLRDVAVTLPQSSDHYNLAQGVPPQNLSNRTLRSLIIPYALTDLGESANKFEWAVGRISDNQVVLPHFTRGGFSTTMDDARWILKRLSSLRDEELKKAVELAYFPAEVSALIQEKLISRRNYLYELFKLDVRPLKVNKKISLGKDLKNGKLRKEDWEGYASRFAHGDPDSPFKDWHWYALAKVQAIVMDNLTSRLTRELVLSNPRKERSKFAWNQFKKGLDHFVKTGEFISFPVSTWFSPVADASVRASRDVVVGNYLGTDNLVQLADTVGFSFKVGGHMGIENVEYVPNLAVVGRVTVSKTWSHLKPLRNLKAAMQEPYRNIAVPLLKWQVANNLRRTQRLQDSTDQENDWNIKEENSALSKLVMDLNRKLGVGESLIFTETITPQTNIQASTNAAIAPVDFQAQASVSENIVRRIQIYRKDAKTIQVYDDEGFSRGWTFDFAIQKFVPILKLGAGKQKGDYEVRVYEVDINPDLRENPRLFDHVHALADFMQTGSSELLAAAQKPHEINAEFEDKSFKFALLSWRLKKLKTSTTFDIKSRDGLEGQFVAFTDEKQTGWNWEAFTKDLINLGMSKVVDGVEWSGNPFQNPAETIHGIGKTNSVRFEASLDEEGDHEERFMRLTDRWEGWSASANKIRKKMLETNAKFGFSLFNDATLGNLDKLKLFNVAVNINLYEDGIQKLSSMNPDRLIQLENIYERELGYEGSDCGGRRIETRRLSSGQKVESCGTLNKVISQNKKCQDQIKKDKSKAKVARCLATLLRVSYEDIRFPDLTQLLGKDNMFVHGSVNGFRNGDEVLNDPIQSNTEGRIGGQFWNGPFDVIQRMLGIQSGEFNGYWLRERL